MVMRSGGFSNLLAPGLRKIYFDMYKGLPTEYDKIFKVSSTKFAYETDYELSMLGGTIASKPEGEAIQYIDPVTGNTKTHTPAPFGSGFRVTLEMYETDRYKKVAPVASKGLAKATRNTIEYNAITVVDDLFNGTYYTCFDGYAICYASHTVLYTGGTFSNVGSTDIGVTALLNACLAIEKQVDTDGVIAGLRAKTVLIPPDLRFIMRELLGSDQKPYTNNNEINVLRDEDLTYMVSHYQSDSDAWAVLASEHDLQFLWGAKPRFENSDDFDTGDAKYKVYFRHTQGCNSPLGIYGSPGG